MSQEYKISSIADFLTVPHEKQAECLRDFETWLNMARQHTRISGLLTEMLGGGIAFSTDHFFWIDDGIAGVTAVQLSDDGSDRSMRLQLTGEKNDE